MKTNVVVGRFQTPELHEGHTTLLKKAYDESDNSLLVILAISNDTPSLKNPYNVETRKRVIKEDERLYPNIKFASIKDYDSDHVWSYHLDFIIDSFAYGHEVKIYHSRDSIKGHYFGRYPLLSVKAKSTSSSTQIREQIINNPVVLPNFERRKGYLQGLADGIKKAESMFKINE